METSKQSLPVGTVKQDLKVTSRALFPHLAELIQEEMAERGWTITDLIMNMGPFTDEKEWGICQLSWEMFFELRDPDIVLGEVMASQIGDAFDVNPKFFTNYHEAWRREAKRLEVKQ